MGKKYIKVFQDFGSSIHDPSYQTLRFCPDPNHKDVARNFIREVRFYYEKGDGLVIYSKSLNPDFTRRTGWGHEVSRETLGTQIDIYVKNLYPNEEYVQKCILRKNSYE